MGTTPPPTHEGPRPLKEWREQHHLSQFELAITSGVGYSTIQGIENNRTVPRIDTVLALCHALGIAVEQVIWPRGETVQLPQSKQLRIFPMDVQIAQSAAIIRITNEGRDAETELARLAGELAAAGQDAELIEAALARVRAVLAGEARKKIAG